MWCNFYLWTCCQCCCHVHTIRHCASISCFSLTMLTTNTDILVFQLVTGTSAPTTVSNPPPHFLLSALVRNDAQMKIFCKYRALSPRLPATKGRKSEGKHRTTTSGQPNCDVIPGTAFQLPGQTEDTIYIRSQWL